MLLLHTYLGPVKIHLCPVSLQALQNRYTDLWNMFHELKVFPKLLKREKELIKFINLFPHPTAASVPIKAIKGLYSTYSKVIRFRLTIQYLTLNDWSQGEQCILFLETKSRKTLGLEGNKSHCSPRDQSLSDLLYSKIKQKQILKNALRFQRRH